MKTILKQFLILLFFFILIYSLVRFIVVISSPLLRENNLDSGTGLKNYLNERQKVVLDRDPLKTINQKIIFLGASNTGGGFRPKEFSPYFPGYEIDNLSVSATNLSEIKKIIELTYEVMPPKAQNKTTFILGLDYLLLVDDKARWNSNVTEIEKEQMRFGLYYQKDGKLQPVVSQKYFSYYVKVLTPFFYIDNTCSFLGLDLKNFFEAISRKVLKSKNPLSTQGKTEHLAIDQAYKDWALNNWSEYMGPYNEALFDEQLNVLLDIVHLISEHGSKLVIVDLPLPAWHQNSSKYFQDYQLKKKKILRLISSYKNIFYIDMQDLNRDEDFIDSGHPKPSMTSRWSQRLSQELNKTVF